MSNNPSLSRLEKLLRQKNLKPEEIKILIDELRNPSTVGKVSHSYHFKTNTSVHKFGIVGDMHIGSKYFDRRSLEIYMERAKKFGVEFLLDPGDSVDGSFNMHRGMWREQNELGFSKQLDAYTKFYPDIGVQTYRINGNHDISFAKSDGADVGIEINRRRPDIVHLGDDQADFFVDKTVIRMLHPDGNAAYADSYKVQKIIEAYGPDEKPHILLIGHFHRVLQTYMRGVHGFLVGTFQGQSAYAKRRAMPNRKGSWLIEFKNIPDGTIVDLTTKFIPFYK